jgi:hypothetical protein
LILSKNDFLVTADSNRNLGNFTSEKINYYVKKAYRRFYFNPNYMIRILNKIIAKRDVKHLKMVLRPLFAPLSKYIF